MTKFRVATLLLWYQILVTTTGHAAALPTILGQKQNTVLFDETSYSFEQFLSDYGRYYHDSFEYVKRKAIFYENLHTIVQHNNLQKNPHNSGGYWMGINSFADHRADELFMGYDKYQSSKLIQGSYSAAAKGERRLLLKHHNKVQETNEHQEVLDKLNIRIDPVEDLPSSVDWRMKGVTTPIKNQGQCGSCWAFASTAVLESHIAISTGVLYELSPQELVSCAPNPQHCGGTGGCAGATAEIAFALVQQYGAVEEWNFGYQDGHGALINCTLTDQTTTMKQRRQSQTTTTRRDKNDNHRHHVGKYFHGAVASITDYVVLPSNNYTVLMNTVAKLGPVTVSVACLPWHLYQGGVFYAPLSPPGRATDVNHLVVLEGYGTDAETGEDYWLVRNSWGPRWGEHGYIRLKRVGDSDCGMDETPADGTACTLDPDGNEITPEPQQICGNSGILFDSAIPLGGYLI